MPLFPRASDVDSKSRRDAYRSVLALVFWLSQVRNSGHSSGRAGLAGALLLTCLTPGRAASPATQAFLANLVPNVDFLDRSSRFALDKSKSPRLRAFARSEAREQTFAIDALWDFTRGNRPLDAKALMAQAQQSGLDTTPTGSAKPAAWPPTPVATGKPDPDEKLPKGQEDLDSLEGLEGAAFDNDFRADQQEALEQVAAGYAGYIATGDDPALKAIAQRELPKVRQRLAALKRF